MLRNTKRVATTRVGHSWVLLCALMFTTMIVSAQSPSAQQTPNLQVPNPGAELWRAVRQRDAPARGMSQVKGVDSGVLINANGDRWRHFRNEQLIPIGGYLLGGVLLLLLVFYLVRGRVPIHASVSDRKLPRYTDYERTIH